MTDRFFVFFAINLTACLLCIDTANGLSLHHLSASLITSFILSWPTSYIKNFKIRVITQIILGLPFLTICIVDCYCQEFFGTQVSPQILSSITLSNPSEISEFLSTYLGLQILKHWRITLLLLLTLLLPFCLFFRIKCSRDRVFSMALIPVVAINLLYELVPSYRYLQLYLYGKDLQNLEGLIFRHYHEEVPTPIHRLAFAYFSLKKSALVLNKIKRSTITAQIENCSFLSPHIILIIGESFNKHHSSLYGYTLSTTPLQKNRMSAGELFAFTDVVTPWNITSNVFLNIFSTWEYGDQGGVETYPLFPILFRRAGYSVNFFSNQYLLSGFLKGATNQAGHFFLSDMELSDYLFTYRNRRKVKYDMGLVKEVKQNKQDLNQAFTLDIIHLIGQHFDYKQRYPREIAFFSINDYSNRNLDHYEKRVLMHYDNATRYNDVVVDSLIRLYEQDDAVIVFLSDHGEEVYDDFPIHGRLFQSPTSLQARNEYEVPMWIWLSERYKINHPNIVSAIRSSLNKPFLTDGIPQVLLFLAGIKCKWTSEQRNILSPQYDPKPRIIGGNVDYDIIIKDTINRVNK